MEKLAALNQHLLFVPLLQLAVTSQFFSFSKLKIMVRRACELHRRWSEATETSNRHICLFGKLPILSAPVNIGNGLLRTDLTKLNFSKRDIERVENLFGSSRVGVFQDHPETSQQ